MCNFHCPYAERKPCAGFLLCRKLYQDGVNYGIRQNAMNVICAHQKQCMMTGRMENTEEAKRCAIIAPPAPVEAVPEAKEETSAPKKTKKKSN